MNELMDKLMTKILVDMVSRTVEKLAFAREMCLKFGVPEEVVTDMLNDFGEAYADLFKQMSIEDMLKYLEARIDKEDDSKERR